MLYVGQIIRQKDLKNKRIFFMVTNVIVEKYNYRVTLSPIYDPSPKSQLKYKNIFSKNKFSIHAAHNSSPRKRRQDGYFK
jgi:hypothetical protein